MSSIASELRISAPLVGFALPDQSLPALIVPKQVDLWVKDPTRLKNEPNGRRINECIKHIWVSLVKVGPDNGSFYLRSIR